MKYSYPFLIYNVNSFRTHNEGNRPFVEAKSQNQPLALIEKMLKMFSIRSIDENANNDIKLLLKNYTFDTKNYLDTCPDALPANCEYYFIRLLLNFNENVIFNSSINNIFVKSFH